jgi:hypothetical protein
MSRASGDSLSANACAVSRSVPTSPATHSPQGSIQHLSPSTSIFSVSPLSESSLARSSIWEEEPVPASPISSIFKRKATIFSKSSTVLFRATVLHTNHTLIDSRLRVNQIVDVIDVNPELWMVRMSFGDIGRTFYCSPEISQYLPFLVVIPPACLSLSHTFNALPRLRARTTTNCE